MRLSRFAMTTYRREELPPLDADVVVEIGYPVRRAIPRRSQATRRDRLAESARPSQGDGWTCPRCRIVNATNAASCRCGALRAR